MDHIEIANLAGVRLGDLDDLLKGRATDNLARALGVKMGFIEDFMRGKPSQEMQIRLRLTTLSATKELATVAGPQGAIGIVIGLLLSE